jgi:hypothetical protein
MKSVITPLVELLAVSGQSRLRVIDRRLASLANLPAHKITPSGLSRRKLLSEPWLSPSKQELKK